MAAKTLVLIATKGESWFLLADNLPPVYSVTSRSPKLGKAD